MTERGNRILVLAPDGNNAVLLATALRDAGIEAHNAVDPEHLARSIEEGAGAAIIEREALDANAVKVLTRVVASQPPWSDFPFIILTDNVAGARLGKLASANVSVVERPIRPGTLIAAVRFALRARQRQYEIREHLSERKRAEAEIQELNQTLRRRNAELEAERARWQGVVEGIAEEVWVCNPQGEMSLVNLGNATAMGLQEFADRRVTDILAEVDISLLDGTPRPPEQAPLLRSLRGEVVRGEEIMQHRQTGTKRYRQFSSAPTRDATGAITGAVAIVRDVTNHKLAEEALRQSEERFRALVSTSSEVLYRMSPDWSEMRYMGGGGFLADTKTPRKDWLQAYIHPDDQRDVWAVIQEAIRTKSLFRLEHRVRRVDGSLGWTLSRAVPLLDPKGEIAEWFGAASDVTSRKQAEEALRETEERFRTLANAMPQLCWMANRDGWITWYNDQWYGYTGTTPEQMEGWGWQSAHDPETLPTVLERWRHSIGTGDPFDMVFPLRGADGVFRPFLTRVLPIKDAEGKIVCWFGTNTDVTELRATQEALRESEQRYRSLFERMLNGFAHCQMLFDEDGRPNDFAYLNVNAAFNELTGIHENVIGKRYSQLFPEANELNPELLAAYGRVVATGQPEQLEICFKPLDIWFSITAYKAEADQFVVVFENITARKQAEQALIRSEKLAATGRMAATIAHEINNPLSAATNAVYLASNDPSVSPRMREMLALADQELRRAAHITQQTLGFYRENGSRTAVALPKLIDEVLGVYRRKLRERDVTVDCRYNCGPCHEGCETCFLVNEGEMRQVISNLLGNGMDALRDNGKLYIRVSRVTNVNGSGQDIHLAIADNGCGIRAENLKRIFEPFFTTKESVGTGLGLWITQELVRKYKGSIKVRSTKDKGTVFRISIPAAPMTSSGATKGEADNSLANITPAAD